MHGPKIYKRDTNGNIRSWQYQVDQTDDPGEICRVVLIFAYIRAHCRVKPCTRPQGGIVMRVAQEPRVEHQIRLRWNPFGVGKRDQRNHHAKHLSSARRVSTSSA